MTGTEATPNGFAMSFDGDTLVPSMVGNKIDHTVSDAVFKQNYSPDILSRRSTLTLKTSFHLINVTLIGLCKVFKLKEEQGSSE